MKFAATALLLLAAVGAARAEQPYGPPATADAQSGSASPKRRAKRRPLPEPWRTQTKDDRGLRAELGN